MADGYDPNKSKVSDDVMSEWRNSAVTGDLLEVPGIGPAAVRMLNDPGETGTDERITCTWQLFGMYLLLKGPGDGDDNSVSIHVHNQKFWNYLKARGIKAHRSAIVKAIAEKSSGFFTGLYDPSLYEEDDL